MKRDKVLALVILQSVEEHADAEGMDITHLRSVVPGRHGVWTVEMIHHLDLLVKGGFLIKKEASMLDAASVQLTWSGYDLLDSLRQ